MRAADRATIEQFGMPSFTLMESAARGAFTAIEERYGSSSGLAAVVLAGKGNNGGDALALARMLAIAGARVLAVTTAGTEGTSADCAHNLALLHALEDDELCLLDIESSASDGGPWDAVDRWRGGGDAARRELSVRDAATLAAICAAFPGARVTRFERPDTASRDHGR